MPRFVQLRFPKAAADNVRTARRSSDKSSTWEALQLLLPDNEPQLPPPTETEASILRAFGRHPDSLLYVPDPKSLPSPFDYHSKCNMDSSYIHEPRLSVTKLLTSAWCELREYYSVYGGSVRQPPSARMKSGTEYHAKLEDMEHFQVNMALLDALMARYMARVPLERREELVETKKEYKMANDWMEHVVKRVLQLARTNMAREIHIHAFLDLDKGELVSDASALKDAVLVNGIADIVKIKPTRGNFQHLDMPGRRIVDLREETRLAAQKFASLQPDHVLVMGDVKTRGSSTLPDQESVLDAAKTQCMYYAQMLGNLTQSETFTYNSYLENASRRRVQADSPMSIAFTAQLLVANFHVLVVDCLRMARGELTGLEAYDNKHVPCTQYSLGDLLSEEEFRELLMNFYGEDPEIMEMDLAPLFQPWQRPLTFRYVAARTAQVMSTLKLPPAHVEVEYHNVVTGRMFEKKRAPFDTQRLQRSVSDAALFWSGQRLPTHTSDTSKCHFCEFRKRCAAINQVNENSVLREVYELQCS